MNWKSYAVVSGATVLAGWLASSSPETEPGAVTPSPARNSPASAASSAAADIAREADRLQARISRDGAYPRPERDPFRFADRRAAPPEPAAAGPEPDESPDPTPPLPAGPAVVLAGIAEDQVEGRPVRTAVLSTSSDVLLVREGEEIPGRYRVVRIESEAVELVSLDDGRVVRLSLR